MLDTFLQDPNFDISGKNVIRLARIIEIPDNEIENLITDHFEDYFDNCPNNITNLTNLPVNELPSFLNGHSPEALARWRRETLASFRSASPGTNQFNIIIDSTSPSLLPRQLARIQAEERRNASADDSDDLWSVFDEALPNPDPLESTESVDSSRVESDSDPLELNGSDTLDITSRTDLPRPVKIKPKNLSTAEDSSDTSLESGDDEKSNSEKSSVSLESEKDEKAKKSKSRKKDDEKSNKLKSRKKAKAKNKSVNEDASNDEDTSNDEDVSNNEPSEDEDLTSSESVNSSDNSEDDSKPKKKAKKNDKKKAKKKAKNLTSKESFVFNSTSGYISLGAAVFSLVVFNPVFFAMALPTTIVVSLAAALMTYGLSELFLSSSSSMHHDASENKTLKRNSGTTLDKDLFTHNKKLTHGFEYRTSKKASNTVEHAVSNQSNAEKRTKVRVR